MMQEQKTQEKLTVFAYCRVSTQDQEHAISMQKTAIRNYAKTHNMKIVEWFEDIASAVSWGKREHWNELIEIISDLEVKPHAIIAYKVDRVARNIRDYVDIIRQLEALNIRLIATDLNISELPDYLQEVVVNILIVFAQLERGMIRTRIKDGLAEKKAQGYKLGRPSKQEEIDVDLYLRLTKAQVPRHMIAKTLGVSKSTLRRFDENLIKD